MDILLKGFLTLWTMCFFVGLVAFYCPGVKAERTSLVLGFISFIAFPAILGIAMVLVAIWG